LRIKKFLLIYKNNREAVIHKFNAYFAQSGKNVRYLS
jgi:hypothetical protein